jgi:hypothetical protein
VSVGGLQNALATVTRKTYSVDAAGSTKVATETAVYTNAECHAHLENQFEAIEMGGIKKNSSAFFVFALSTITIVMDDYITWSGVKYQVTSVNRRIKPGGFFSHLEVRGEAIQNGTS